MVLLSRFVAPAECAVCFEVTTDVLDGCGHSLCHLCAVEWLRRNASCPMCRARVPVTNLPPPDTLSYLSLPTGELVQQLHLWVEAGTEVSYRLGQFHSIRFVAIVVLSLEGIIWPQHLSLRRGQVITHIDGRRVHTVGEVSRCLDDAIDDGRHLHVGVLVAPTLELAHGR